MMTDSIALNWIFENLGAIANFAAILTTVIAVFGYGAYSLTDEDYEFEFENVYEGPANDE